MYCPRCSQQQVSDNVSFCSRCGFQLAGVKKLLVTEGDLPARKLCPQASIFLAGRKGVRLGTKLVFFSVILLPLFFALSYTFDSPIPFWFPAVVFLAGLTCMLYFSIFREDNLPSKQKAPSTSSGRIANSSALPSRSVAPIGELDAMRVNTAEMIQPPSISEHTTNRLKKSES